jgi:hypothetical protein
MHLKSDDSLDRRSVMLMLSSVVLFAANTLMIRAVAQHTPAADGWVAIIFRGAVGLAVVYALFGRGRGLDPHRQPIRPRRQGRGTGVEVSALSRTVP